VDTIVVHSPPFKPSGHSAWDWLSTWLEHEASDMYNIWANSFTWKVLKFLASLVRIFFVWMPFVFVWTFMLWACSLVTHIAQNPEVLAKGTFSVVSSVPQYTFWAFGRMAQEFCASAVAYWP
jgi:hypothetical protein